MTSPALSKSLSPPTVMNIEQSLPVRCKDCGALLRWTRTDTHQCRSAPSAAPPVIQIGHSPTESTDSHSSEDASPTATTLGDYLPIDDDVESIRRPKHAWNESSALTAFRKSSTTEILGNNASTMNKPLPPMQNNGLKSNLRRPMQSKHHQILMEMASQRPSKLPLTPLNSLEGPHVKLNGVTENLHSMTPRRKAPMPKLHLLDQVPERLESLRCSNHRPSPPALSKLKLSTTSRAGTPRPANVSIADSKTVTVKKPSEMDALLSDLETMMSQLSAEMTLRSREVTESCDNRLSISDVLTHYHHDETSDEAELSHENDVIPDYQPITRSASISVSQPSQSYTDPRPNLPPRRPSAPASFSNLRRHNSVWLRRRMIHKTLQAIYEIDSSVLSLPQAPVLHGPQPNGPSSSNSIQSSSGDADTKVLAASMDGSKLAQLFQPVVYDGQLKVDLETVSRQRCFECKVPIATGYEPHLEACGRVYHLKCFKCQICGKIIQHTEPYWQDRGMDGNQSSNGHDLLMCSDDYRWLVQGRSTQ